LGVLLVVLLQVGCGEERATDQGVDQLTIAEALIDAFYSWNAEVLAAQLPGVEQAGAVLYYQAWAEAAHYQVQTRNPCYSETDAIVKCAITVTDDFGETLGYVATDTFTLSFADGALADVAFEGDDPPIFDELFQWMSENHPEVFAGPCRDLFAGGTTPAACARAVVQSAREFMAIPGRQ